MSDIFEVLEKISTGDISYFRDISDKDFKSLSPYIIMRWMYSTKNYKQILNLNEIVNTTLFKNHNHKLLQVYSLMAASVTSTHNHHWIKNITNIKPNQSILCIMEYYNCSASHAIDYIKLLTLDNLLELAAELGYDNDQHKKIKNESKVRI